MSDNLLNIEQAAAYLRCSTKSLRRMVADKQLPERRIRSRKLMFIQVEPKSRCYSSAEAKPRS